MKIEDLRIHMRVKHPLYAYGEVKSISSKTAEILFNEGMKTVEPESSQLAAAEAQASISSLDIPLPELIRKVIDSTVEKLDLKQGVSDEIVQQLGVRWQKGTLILKPADSSLQNKEVPLETFFHKIVMIRDNLRILEQKINSNKILNDAEKVEWQQYITKCHGSLTTFNILFKEKDQQFGS
jgi:hypothetical protein